MAAPSAMGDTLVILVEVRELGRGLATNTALLCLLQPILLCFAFLQEHGHSMDDAMFAHMADAFIFGTSEPPPQPPQQPQAYQVIDPLPS